jgi:hypothetical protein
LLCQASPSEASDVLVFEQWLELLGNGWNCLAMAGIAWQWLELLGNGGYCNQPVFSFSQNAFGVVFYNPIPHDEWFYHGIIQRPRSVKRKQRRIGDDSGTAGGWIPLFEPDLSAKEGLGYSLWEHLARILSMTLENYPRYVS